MPAVPVSITIRNADRLQHVAVTRLQLYVAGRVHALFYPFQAWLAKEVSSAADADGIAALSLLRPMAALDGDAEMVTLARRRFKANRLIKKLDEVSSAARARMDVKMMKAAAERGAQPGQTVLCAAGPYRVTSTPVAATEGKIVTEDMVGTHIGARKAFRMLRVTQPTPKEKK